MRALLVANPAATSTTARTRDVIVRALGSDLKVDLADTRHRGHAGELAAQARAEAYDVVIALGGDGTVNEVVNGLLADALHGPVPLFAVVPGGSTNVFARAVGLPPDPFEATSQLLDALCTGRVRRIGLGRADERWFTVNAGMGWDAGVVAEVERRRLAGARSTHSLYVRTSVREYYRGEHRRSIPLVLRRPGQEPVEDLFLAVVQNAAPWTYLGERPLSPSPGASFDAGLDLFALRRARTVTVLRHARQLLSGPERAPRGRRVLSLHDERELVVGCEDGAEVQVDGEALGRRTQVNFRSVPDALTVLT